jgi:hypothetical protein
MQHGAAQRRNGNPAKRHGYSFVEESSRVRFIKILINSMIPPRTAEFAREL